MGEKWNWAKGLEEAMKKKIEAYKTQAEKLLMQSGETNIKSLRYELNKRMQSRESCSKKDLPASIWSQYAKTSTFTVLSFKSLSKAAAKKAASKPKAKTKAKATKKWKQGSSASFSETCQRS